MPLYRDRKEAGIQVQLYEPSLWNRRCIAPPVAPVAVPANAAGRGFREMGLVFAVPLALAVLPYALPF